MGWKRWRVWGIHGRADIHTCQTKRGNMTRHGIRDIDFSSRRVGPAFPVLTGTGRSYHSLTPLFSTSSQSMNQIKLRVSTTVTSSTATTRGTLDKIHS